MYELKIIDSFSSAHQLREYKGKCENLHGHNWKIEVLVKSDKLDKAGLVIDFSDLKKYLRIILQELDHKFLNDLTEFRIMNPTSENLSKYIFDKFEKILEDRNVLLTKVTVWESESASASYSR